MKTVMDPGHEKKTLTLVDNIVFAHRVDLEGNPLDLTLSIMSQNGNSEMKLAVGEDDPKEDHTPKPVLVWMSGGGWRGADKNQMLGEMVRFAEAGYAVACISYRSSAQGKWPAQMVDVKEAVRFLRANADKYELDSGRVGVFGRSAGAHLASLLATNVDLWNEGSYPEFSSEVQACVDMFGPVSVSGLMDLESSKFSDPNFRWHKVEDTHGGALMGGDPATIRERAVQADVIPYISNKMAPIQILHGDNDPIVPMELTSEPFYEALCKAGLEGQTDYYILKHAGHGSREFFQDSVKDLMIQFFDRYLK